MTAPHGFADRDPDPRDGSRSSVEGAQQRPVGGSPPHQTRRGRRRGREKRQLPLWQEVIVLLAIALGLAILLKSLFVQAFYIPSASMHFTLVENDRILVEKPSYWFDGPERGDIVVFADPGGWLSPQAQPEPNAVQEVLEFFGLYPTGDHLVKRVIGIEGDRVECCDKRGRITVNGTPLNEDAYLPPGVRPNGSSQPFSVLVPEDRLWVMGDNRSASADSRVHIGDPGGGFIPVTDVVGRVFVTVWPLDRAEFHDQPATFERFDSAGPVRR